jgi:hypothetical protein
MRNSPPVRACELPLDIIALSVSYLQAERNKQTWRSRIRAIESFSKSPRIQGTETIDTTLADIQSPGNFKCHDFGHGIKLCEEGVVVGSAEVDTNPFVDGEESERPTHWT